MSSLDPPFRADHVGSLLRPKPLLEARDQFRQQQISKDQLREVEDRSIRDVVNKQESVGLHSITDGEYRRTFFYIDFLERLEGVTVSGAIETKFKRQGGDINFAPPRLSVTVEGNDITEDQQWAKLERVVATAREVWGD